MGRDSHPKERQRRDLERQKQHARVACERILIVSEGSKTEPQYFDEIRIDQRLPIRNVTVTGSAFGTAPIQIVQYAKDRFEKGDVHKGWEPRAFDRVYAVFDRDDHESYFEALRVVRSLDGKITNDEKQRVPFKAIVSIPNFELWLLLHYADVQAPMHRDEVMSRLKRHIPGYAKGMRNTFELTRDHLAVAINRARLLAAKFNADTAPEPYTAIGDLVGLLTALRN